MLSRRRREGRVVVGEGTGQWGGHATIMMCGCDVGWYCGGKSLRASSNGSRS
jgi:hypothetical protein